MRRLLQSMVCTLFVIIPAIAHGEEITPLPELVVIAGPFSEAERSTTSNNFVIDEATIRNSNAANLSELLTEMGFPNEASPTDYGENVTLIRGYQTDHLMVELSGKILFLINGKRSGVANARQLTLNNIERVEVIRGPEMFKYSLGSPGGVINIVTKKGGPSKVGGRLEAGAGSWDTYRTSASINGLLDNFDYSVGYAHKTMRTDYKDGDGTRVNNTKTSGTHNAFANIGYTFNELHRISTDIYHYKVDAAHRPTYVDEEGEVRAASYMDRETQLYYINYDGKTENERWAWHANFGYGEDYYHTYSNSGPYPMGNETSSWRAQAGLDYKSEYFDISSGTDFIRYDVENGSNTYRMHDTYSQQIFGAYSIGTLKLFDNKFNISGGLRYEYVRIKDKAIGDEGYESNRNVMMPRDALPVRRSFAHTSPSIGVSYLPIDWLKLRANYTQGYRAPSGRQLFASNLTEGYGAPGDPRLKAELSDNYEAGFDVALDHLRFSTTFFYNKIMNNSYIYNGPVSGRICRNAEERLQSGLEVGLSADVLGALGYSDYELRPYFNMTYMFKKSEVMEKNGTGRDGADALWWPILRMPDLTMNYGVRFRHLPSQFSANLNFNYYGEQYGSRMNATSGIDYHDYAFGKFTIVNFSMSKRLVDFEDKGNVELQLHVNNIFDKVYSYSGRVPDDTYAFPGRNYHATLVYNF